MPDSQPELPDLVGTTISAKYRIEARLGQGGMGIVYRARHIELDIAVAIKILLQPGKQEDQQRFVEEARIASKIQHPSIVVVFDFGVLPEGNPYLVMELLRGTTLAEAIQHGRLDTLRACQIASQVAGALATVHEQGIIHRELSI